MVDTTELRQIFQLRKNTLRHVVEGDGRYPRAMTPNDDATSLIFLFLYYVPSRLSKFSLMTYMLLQ